MDQQQQTGGLYIFLVYFGRASKFLITSDARDRIFDVVYYFLDK